MNLSLYILTRNLFIATTCEEYVSVLDQADGKVSQSPIDIEGLLSFDCHLCIIQDIVVLCHLNSIPTSKWDQFLLDHKRPRLVEVKAFIIFSGES